MFGLTFASFRGNEGNLSIFIYRFRLLARDCNYCDPHATAILQIADFTRWQEVWNCKSLYALDLLASRRQRDYRRVESIIIETNRYFHTFYNRENNIMTHNLWMVIFHYISIYWNIIMYIIRGLTYISVQCRTVSVATDYKSIWNKYKNNINIVVIL